jgi:hypothetical protein
MVSHIVVRVSDPASLRDPPWVTNLHTRLRAANNGCVLRPIKTREEIMQINPIIALQTQGERKEEVFEPPYVVRIHHLLSLLSLLTFLSLTLLLTL